MRRVLFAAGLPLFFLLGVLHMDRETVFRERCLSQMTEGQTVLLAGKVERIEEKTRCFYYYLTDCTIRLSGESMPCNTVLAYIPDDAYSIGEILVIRGKISLFGTAANEGGFDEQAYYQSQKIDFAVDAGQVETAAKSQFSYPQLLWRFRRRLKAVIGAVVDDDGVLAAMLLGDRAGLDADIRTLYQRAGISHILAISGLHVSILGMGLYRLLRNRLHASYPMAAAGTAAWVISYGCMTGNAVSTKRAILMLLVYLLSNVLGRGYDLLSALGAAVLLLLWENPFLTGYSGFLFSTVAVLGIGVGGQVMRAWSHACEEAEEKSAPTHRPTLRERIAKRLSDTLHGELEGIVISLSIQLFTLPLVAWCYYELPTYALLVNLFVLGLMGPILVMAAAGAVGGLFSLRIAAFLLAPCEWLLAFYQWICERIVQLPGAQYIVGKPSLWRVGVYYLLLAGALFALWMWSRRLERLRERAAEAAGSEATKGGYGMETQIRMHGASGMRFIRKYATVGTAICAILVVLLFPQKKQFEVDILDVGQGDGIYLCTDDAVSMFIDGGSSSVNQVGTYRILPFLKSRGVKSISYWFVSHADADHISGLQEAIAAGYRIEHLVVARAAQSEEKIVTLVQQAEEVGIPVVYMAEGDALRTETGTVCCLYPEAGDRAEDANDLSLVLQFSDTGRKALFAGDISEETEQKLVDRGLCTEVDFFKADHHGSKYANSTALLERIAPLITVASAGAGNLYGHPSPVAVERILDAGSDFLCTADCGQVKWTGANTLLKSQ
jgi:competence protein ComEC